jgi:O-antigen/teichoic acid export membrane protein
VKAAIAAWSFVPPKVNLNRNPVLRNTGLQFIGKGITASADLLVTFLITRALGAAGYADFAKVFTLVALLYLGLDFGFNAIIVRRLGHKPQALAAEFSTLLSTRLAYAFMLFMLLGLFLLLTPTAVDTGYTFPVKIAILIFGLSLFTQSLFTSVNAIFQHRLDYFPAVLAAALGALSGLVAVIISLIFSPGLISLVTAHLFGSLVMAATSFVFITRLTPVRWHCRWPAIRNLIVATLPIGLMLLLNALMIRLDTIIVTLTRPNLEIGWLGLAYRLYDNLLILPLFCLNALYPIMIQRFSLSPAHLRHLVWRSAQILFLASLCLGLILFFATPLLVIFGSDMLPAAPALKILSLALPWFFLTSLLQWTLITLHRERVLITAYALGLIFNAAINFWAIPRFGYLAAATTTGLTEVLVFILLLFPVLKSFQE